MASKTYTAKELREMATMLEEERRECSICMYDEYDDEWRPLWMKPNPVVLALRQAADAMEREKKYQYQYAARYFYKSGVIATDHIFDNPRDAKHFSCSRDGAKKIICRREVGEWEEVKE